MIEKPLTEWSLQQELTKEWAISGTQVDGVHCMLVAWEVMLPSWRINDSRVHWNEPSLDFLLADEAMNLVVVELKREVLGVVPAWRVLAQVTHRSLLVVDTMTEALIEQAWQSCWSGQHGRLPKQDVGSFREAHQAFFKLPAETIPFNAVRRAVAALRFGPNWPEILRVFNESGHGRLGEELETMASPKGATEIRRLIGLRKALFEQSLGPVSSMLVRNS